MKIEKNGLTKEIATGYSWKSLLFGALYPAARGDVKGFFVQIVLGFISFGLSWLFVPFKYNSIYLERMISDGWQIIDVENEILIKE